jgi:hypothetical protein
MKMGYKRDIVRLADRLDALGLYKEADILDGIIKKVSQSDSKKVIGLSGIEYEIWPEITYDDEYVYWVSGPENNSPTEGCTSSLSGGSFKNMREAEEYIKSGDVLFERAIGLKPILEKIVAGNTTPESLGLSTQDLERIRSLTFDDTPSGGSKPSDPESVGQSLYDLYEEFMGIQSWAAEQALESW